MTSQSSYPKQVSLDRGVNKLKSSWFQIIKLMKDMASKPCSIYFSIFELTFECVQHALFLKYTTKRIQAVYMRIATLGKK